jgi:hypothetical protein
MGIRNESHSTKHDEGKTTVSKSCVGCKFLYSEGSGYSNWTWESDDVRCAKDRNPNLPADKPWDWKQDASADNWPHTNQSRCELYAEGTFVSMDVEGEDGPADTSSDQEQIYAICAHSKRPPSGYGK